MSANNSSQYLATLVAKRLRGLFELPVDFPNLKFDWVNEEEEGANLKLEASAPGQWQMNNGFSLSHALLTAEIHQGPTVNGSRGCLEGELSLGRGSFPARYQFPGPFQFAGEARDYPLHDVLEPLAGGEPFMSWLPAFQMRALRLQYSPATGSFALSGHTEEVWMLEFGRDGLPMWGIQMELSREEPGRPVTGSISGSVRIGGAEIQVTTELGEAPLFKGAASKVWVEPTVDELCDLPALAHLATPFRPELNSVTITLNLESKLLILQGDTIEFGPMMMALQFHEGIWGFVAEAELHAPFWRFSSEGEFLRPFDRLDLSDVSMMVTSFDKAPYFLGDSNLGEVEASLGHNFRFHSRIHGFAELDFLGRLLGPSFKADMTAVLAKRSDGAAFSLSVPLPPFAVQRGVSWESASLELSETENGLRQTEVNGTTRIDLRTDHLDFRASMSVEGHSGSLVGTLAQPWKSPYGIDGLLVDPLQLEVVVHRDLPAAPRIIGRAHLAEIEGLAEVMWPQMEKQHRLRIQFDEIPFLHGLSGLFPESSWASRSETAFIFQKSLTQVLLVLSTNGHEIEGNFQLAGALCQFHGEIPEPGQLTATATMEAISHAPVSPGVFVFQLDPAGSREERPVHVALGTGDEPTLELAAQVNLFGEFSESIVARATEAGLEFPFVSRRPGAKLDLACVATEQGVRAQGSLECELDLILTPESREDSHALGQATLREAILDGRISLSLDQNFRAEIRGWISWNGINLEIPAIILTETPRSFSHFEQLMKDGFQSRALSILLPLIRDRDAFFRAAQEGWFRTGKELHLRPSELGAAIRTELGLDLESIAQGLRRLGYSAHEVGQALMAAGPNPNADTAVSCLRTAGFSGVQIVSTLHMAMGQESRETAKALRALGFDIRAITQALQLGVSASARQVVVDLHYAGFDPSDIALMMRDPLRASASASFRAFKEAGVKVKETIPTLLGVFDTDRTTTQALLASAGYSPREIRGGLDKYFGSVGRV